jgi:hypothetical protein
MPPGTSSLPASQTHRWASKQHVVLLQPPLGKISIASWPDWQLPHKQNNTKQNKNWIINKQQRKGQVANRVGCPEHQRVGKRHSPMGTVNKQACRRRQVWHNYPRCAWRGEGFQRDWSKAHSTREWREHYPTWTVHKQGLQLKQASRALHLRKEKGQKSRRSLNKQSQLD